MSPSPVRICPSACKTTLERRLFSTSTWCVSATPSSHGKPAFLIPVHELAPVPPSCPEITICSAFPYMNKQINEEYQLYIILLDCHQPLKKKIIFMLCTYSIWQNILTPSKCTKVLFLSKWTLVHDIKINYFKIVSSSVCVCVCVLNEEITASSLEHFGCKHSHPPPPQKPKNSWQLYCL